MSTNNEKRSYLKQSILTLCLLVVSTLSLQAYASGDHDSHGKMNHSSKIRQKLSESTKGSILKVLESNEKLQSSFFKYDTQKIEDNAKELQASIEKIDDQKIKKLLKFSVTKLSLMTKNSSRKDNNQNYHLVSMALIHLINTYEVGGDYNAFSCPMVKKKWIQNTSKNKTVNNPYAPKMAMCGSQDSKF